MSPGGPVVDENVGLPAVGHSESDNWDVPEHGFPPCLIGPDRGRCGQLPAVPTTGADPRSRRALQSADQWQGGKRRQVRAAPRDSNVKLGELNLTRALVSRAADKRYLERRQRRFNSSSRAYNYPVPLKPEVLRTRLATSVKNAGAVAVTAPAAILAGFSGARNPSGGRPSCPKPARGFR